MLKDERELVLREFLLDINCLDKLQKWGNTFNLFDILKISRSEIRHSNVLAWLLDPNENHTLGDAFVKRLFQYFVRGLRPSKDTMRLLLMDFYSFSILREWKNIDILMISDKEKVIIAFENKVGTTEHDNQLQRYKKILNDEYPDYKKFLFYLTPDGEKPTDEDWEILAYEEIVNTLSDICQQTNIASDILLMINNYIEIIRRDVMEDKELIDICTKIYSKHKKALDLIYEHRMNSTQTANIIVDVLQDLSKKGDIIFENNKTNTFIRFCTENMNRFLPDLPNKVSWGNKHSYAYEFHLLREKFTLCITLIVKDIPDSIRVNMDKLISHERYTKKVESLTYVNLHKTVYNIPEELEDSNKIMSIIRKSIKDILSWEKEVLSSLK